MTSGPSWIADLPRQALACRLRLPWERGLRRAAFIRRRCGGTRGEARPWP